MFGLFDTCLDDHTKEQMAAALLATPCPAVFPPGKPVFPEQQFKQQQTNLTLQALVGAKSWLLFELLHSDGAWLHTPANQWAVDQDFTRMLKTVQYIEVVNDAAERGVKDVEDYANKAKDGNYRDN